MLLDNRQNLNPKLISLRIPTGWIVRWNTLFESDPIVQDGKLIYIYNSSEDQLWLERLVPDDMKGKWKELNLDVGWYGETFRLVLFESNWENVIKTFESLHVKEIQEKIDGWLEILSQNFDEPVAYNAL